MPRWYFVNQIGMATVCADKSDAEKEALEADQAWPRHAPHVVMQLVDAVQLEDERTARRAAQRQLADLQELHAKSGLAHRMAVQRAVQEAVREAVATEREACAEIAADEDHIVDVPSYYTQLGDAKATARNIEKAIRARGSQ